MSLVPSLLQAIVQIDGEALVMHAGDKPYVVSPTGQVDLASRGLTLDAVNGIISQLLPAEVLEALDEFGAAQYQLPTRPDFPQEQFTIVAARGGDDIWAEIRRRRIPEEDQIPEELFGPAATQGTLDDVQRAHIEHVLSQCGWRINGRANAAERLGLHPNTLRFRMKKLGIISRRSQVGAGTLDASPDEGLVADGQRTGLPDVGFAGRADARPEYEPC